jgi:hypothetical protein
MLVEHTDLPLFSQEDTCKRRKLRQQIKNPNVELSDDEGDFEAMGQVQIMGLELLQATAQLTSDNNEEEDDYSYDSYANDSMGSFPHQALAMTLETPGAAPVAVAAPVPVVATAPLNSNSQVVEQVQPLHRPFRRRMSNCSSIGENVEQHPLRATSDDNHNNVSYSTLDGSLGQDAYGYGYGNFSPVKRRQSIADSVDFNRFKSTARRGSMDSSLHDSVDYGRYKSTTTRRSSLGSYADDSVDYGKYKSTKTQNRRSSLGSYADDSVDYGKYKSTKTQARRSSLGSYAGDSVEYARYKNTRTQARRSSLDSYAGDSVDYGKYKSTKTQNRRSSLGSHADDSVDYGKYKSTKTQNRRSSLGSYADDSVDYGKYKSTKTQTRRSSLGSYADDSVDYGRYKSTKTQTRRSSLGSYADDSVDYGKYKSTKTQTRRSSLGSYAGDSVDYGRYKSTARRSSIESYAGDSVEGGHYNSHKNAGIKTARRDSGFGIARRGSMGSYAADSVDYGRHKNTSSGFVTARRGSMESNAADSVDYGRYKKPARRASIESVEYGRYKNPARSSSTLSADSVDLACINSIIPKSAEPLKPPGVVSRDAGFLIKPPARRATLAEAAPHMLLKKESFAAAPTPASGTQMVEGGSPTVEKVEKATAEKAEKVAEKIVPRKHKSRTMRRASLGSYAPVNKSNSNSVDSQSSTMKNSSHRSRPQGQQQRQQRRFSNMSDYATDSIADVVGRSGGARKMLGSTTTGSSAGHNPTKRRFSMNSCCTANSGEATVLSFGGRAA